MMIGKEWIWASAVAYLERSKVQLLEFEFEIRNIKTNRASIY